MKDKFFKQLKQRIPAKKTDFDSQDFSEESRRDKTVFENEKEEKEDFNLYLRNVILKKGEFEINDEEDDTNSAHKDFDNDEKLENRISKISSIKQDKDKDDGLKIMRTSSDRKEIKVNLRKMPEEESSKKQLASQVKPKRQKLFTQKQSMLEDKISPNDDEFTIDDDVINEIDENEDLYQGNSKSETNILDKENREESTSNLDISQIGQIKSVNEPNTKLKQMETMQDRAKQAADNLSEAARAKAAELKKNAEIQAEKIKKIAGEKAKEYRHIAGEKAKEYKQIAGEKAKVWRETAGVKTQEYRQIASEKYGEAKVKAEDLMHEGTEYVKKNPGKSVAAAFALGVVAALIVRRD